MERASTAWWATATLFGLCWWLNSPVLGLLVFGGMFLHELGHAAALRFYRMPVEGFTFIPFLGMAVSSSAPYPSARAQFMVSLAGPAAGLAASLSLWGVYLAFDLPSCFLAAIVLAWYNLANMLPALPLDGGRMLEALLAEVEIDDRLFLLIMGTISSLVLLIAVREPWFAMILTVLAGLTFLVEYSTVPQQTLLPAMVRADAVQATVSYGLVAGLLALAALTTL